MSRKFRFIALLLACFMAFSEVQPVFAAAGGGVQTAQAKRTATGKKKAKSKKRTKKTASKKTAKSQQAAKKQNAVAKNPSDTRVFQCVKCGLYWNMAGTMEQMSRAANDAYAKALGPMAGLFGFTTGNQPPRQQCKFGGNCVWQRIQ